MHALVLAVMVTAAPKPPATLRFRDWYPGFLPGAYGRTSLTLTSTADGKATLELTFEQPPDTERRQFNPKQWAVVPEKSSRLSGTWRHRGKSDVSWWFDVPGATERVALVCTTGTRQVHAAGATVTPNEKCSPCYDDPGPCKPTWRPAKTHSRRGLVCRVVNAEEGAEVSRAELPGTSLPEELFFLEPPGVEFVRGATDCPPEGLREASP
jgi:hypothetical protein